MNLYSWDVFFIVLFLTLNHSYGLSSDWHKLLLWLPIRYRQRPYDRDGMVRANNLNQIKVYRSAGNEMEEEKDREWSHIINTRLLLLLLPFLPLQPLSKSRVKRTHVQRSAEG